MRHHVDRDTADRHEDILALWIDVMMFSLSPLRLIFHFRKKESLRDRLQNLGLIE
jgi:hypothetical protein